MPSAQNGSAENLCSPQTNDDPVPTKETIIRQTGNIFTILIQWLNLKTPSLSEIPAGNSFRHFHIDQFPS